MILSDSLSFLQAIVNLKDDDHYILVKILELRLELTRDEKQTVFVWVPGKLQALVFNILPATTAVFSYAIGS